MTRSESHSKLVAARTQFKSTSHLSPDSKPQAPTLGILPLQEGKGIGAGSKQGRDRKPVTEEQEVVVGVHPAAVCSHCMLITAASSSPASERPPRPACRGSDKGVHQVSQQIDTRPSTAPAASRKLSPGFSLWGLPRLGWELGGGAPFVLSTDRSEDMNLSAVRPGLCVNTAAPWPVYPALKT